MKGVFRALRRLGYELESVRFAWSRRRRIAHRPECASARRILPRNRREDTTTLECRRGCLHCRPTIVQREIGHE